MGHTVTVKDPEQPLETQDPSGWSILTENISYRLHPESVAMGIQIADLTPDCQIGKGSGAPSPRKDDEPSPPPVGSLHPYFQPFDSVKATLTAGQTFDESCDVSSTYLGCVTGDLRKKPFEIEQSVDIDAKCAVDMHLPTGVKVCALIDTGATKSYLSKRVFDGNEYLKSLP